MTAVEISSRAAEWQRHHGQAAKVVTAVAVHPGLVDTPLARHYFENDYIPAWIRPVAWPMLRASLPWLLIKPDRSVQTMVHAAFGDVEDIDGQYLDVCGVSSCSPLAHNSAERGKLWQVSCELARMSDPLPGMS
jgi:NAD(P)-dependent dehydrogenase (short-subunit alcohol dehydrogenase family)